MGILDHLNIIRGQRRIDLPSGHERNEIARSKLINLLAPIRVRHKRAVKADQDRAHRIAGQGA